VTGAQCLYYLAVVLIGTALARTWDVGLLYGGHPGWTFPAVVVTGIVWRFIYRDFWNSL
jgi:hypothetical protein